MLATSAMSDVQTQAMPSMTLPATVWAGSDAVAKSTNDQIHAARAARPAMPTSIMAVRRVNPEGLIANAASAELRGINANFVDEVAVVATQAAMSPRPQTTCPVT